MKQAFFKHLQPPSPSAQLAAAILFAFASQGCGRAAPQQTNQLPARNLTEAQTLAKQGNLTCADAQNCPQSVALLTVAESTSVNLCTSFLIAPDLMATNSHCIPAELKAAGADCSGRIWARFADLPGAPGEQVGCKSIMQASKVDPSQPVQPDYAFFKLDRALARPPLAMSHEGFADGAQYLVDKINPVSKIAPRGSLEQVRCKTPRQTLITPDSDSELSLTSTLADCEIVHGNSGSPVLDEAGKVRGIVQATQLLDKLKSNLAEKNIALVEGDVAPLGIGTCFACIRVPSEPASLALPDGCVSIGDKKPSIWLGNNEKEIQKTVAQWDALASPSSLHVQWSESGELAQSETFTVAPRCFKPALAWMDSSLSSQTLELDLPLWTSHRGVNRYLQPRYRVTLGTRSIHARLSFHPAQLRSGASQVTLSTDELSSSSQTIFDGAIPVCR